MDIDKHPWIVAYLVGCVFVILLMLFKYVFFACLYWLVKGNILRKNLQKVQPPEDTFWEKVVTFSLLYGIEIALSWIGVLLGLWHFATTFLQFTREVFTSMPEEVKVLRYPLRNNPDMSREAVWAYIRALEMKAGAAQPTDYALLQSLEYLQDYYPSLDRAAALNHLNGLKVVSSDVIAAALARLRPRHNEVCE